MYLYIAISKHFYKVPHLIIPEIRVIITYLLKSNTIQMSND